MIPSTIILPTEQPLDINDVKRALMTYEKVYIPDPKDRDVVPPNETLDVHTKYYKPEASPLFSYFRFPQPTNPLSKVAKYDEEFDRVLDKCREAVKDGKIEVFSPYEGSQNFVTGINSQERLNPLFVFEHYRVLTTSQEFVSQMYNSLGEINDEIIEKLGLEYLQGFETNDSSKASIQNDKLSKDAIILINSLCHSRIGNLIKYIAYGYFKNLVPYSSDKGYINTMTLLERNYSFNINQLKGGEVEFAQRLSKVQDVIFQEIIDEEAIQNLSIKELLKRRDKEWGEYREAKDILKHELDIIAMGTSDLHEFKLATELKLKEYKALQKGISSDVQKTVLPYTIAGALATWLHDTNFSELLSGSFDPTIFFAVGGIMAGKKILEDLTKKVIDFKNQNDKIISHPGHAMTKHYKSIVYKR